MCGALGDIQGIYRHNLNPKTFRILVRCLVAKSCLTLRLYGLQPARLLCPWDFPARMLEWAAISFSSGSFWPRDWIWVRRPGFNHWVAKIHWRRERLPTPVFWSGEFHDCIVHGVTKCWIRLSNFHFQGINYEKILI